MVLAPRNVSQLVLAFYAALKRQAEVDDPSIQLSGPVQTNRCLRPVFLSIRYFSVDLAKPFSPSRPEAQSRRSAGTRMALVLDGREHGARLWSREGEGDRTVGTSCSTFLVPTAFWEAEAAGTPVKSRENCSTTPNPTSVCRANRLYLWLLWALRPAV